MKLPLDRYIKESFPRVDLFASNNLVRHSHNNMNTSRVSSATSTFSNQEEKKKIEELINISFKKKLFRVVRLYTVVVIPITTLLVMTGILLQKSRTTASQIEKTKLDITFAIDVSKIVNMLQIERGTTAMYMSYNVSNIGNIEDVQRAREKTDGARIVVASDMMKVTLSSHSGNTMDFTYVIKMLRKDIDENKLSIKTMISRYTTLNHRLLDLSISSFDLSTQGMPWKTIVSINTLTRTSDSIGIQRALGSTFFVTCEFNRETELWFMALETELQTYMQQSFFYYPQGEAIYKEELDKTDNVLDKITNMKSVIWKNNSSFKDTCNSLNKTDRLTNGNYWFREVTVLIEILRNVREEAGIKLLKTLDDFLLDSKKTVAMYTTVTVLITITSSLLGLIYGNSINKMTEEIKKYSDKVGAQNCSGS